MGNIRQYKVIYSTWWLLNVLSSQCDFRVISKMSPDMQSLTKKCLYSIILIHTENQSLSNISLNMTVFLSSVSISVTSAITVSKIP